MRLAAFQPDQPGNVGAMVRVCACFQTGFDVIEPCGFPFSLSAVRRAAMDYAKCIDLQRHDSWTTFERGLSGRLILLTTQGETPLWETVFREDDVILVGQESAGAPDHVHARAAVRTRIPIAAAARSLNVAVAAAIVLAEARRQVGPPPA